MKFVDKSVLRDLGLFNGVHTLLERRGIHGFMNVAAQVYPRLTLEFLSTLTRHESSEGKYCVFHALNYVYTMPYHDIAWAFNWVIRVAEYVVPKEKVIKGFWLASTVNCPYKTYGNKLSQIYHPPLRYIFQFLAMTIFGQREPGSVSNTELACLKPFVCDDQGTPDWVDIFVGRCLSIQSTTKGKIAIGGMIILLVWYLGLEILNACAELDSASCNTRTTALLLSYTLFDVCAQDTAESLCNTTYQYSLQRPVDQAHIAARMPINLDEDEGDDEEEEEEYVPKEE